MYPYTVPNNNITNTTVVCCKKNLRRQMEKKLIIRTTCIKNHNNAQRQDKTCSWIFFNTIMWADFSNKRYIYFLNFRFIFLSQQFFSWSLLRVFSNWLNGYFYPKQIFPSILLNTTQAHFQNKLHNTGRIITQKKLPMYVVGNSFPFCTRNVFLDILPNSFIAIMAI